MDLTLHKGYLPGCIGRITELHARFYAVHTGFGVYFESKVARELAAFCERYDETRDGLWLALLDGQVEGAIVIDRQFFAGHPWRGRRIHTCRRRLAWLEGLRVWGLMQNPQL